MEKKTLYFKADNQSLVGQNVPARLASDTVSYIEAVFDLSENWSGFDAVKAVWSTDFDSLCTVLDSSGACVVPHEVLGRVGDVWVNLVGSISEDETLTDRLTTYPIKAIVVDANAAVCGSETSPITPSQFDQFVEAVKADADRAEEGATTAAASASAAATSAAWSDERATDSSNAAYTATNARAEAERWASEANRAQYYAWQEAENAGTSARDAEEAKDTILNMTATATTLPEGSQATVDYSGGVMAFGIPRGDTGAKGDTGDKGDTGATPNLSIGTVETLAPDEDATATITGTAENPVLNLGLPKGDTGEVSLAELIKNVKVDEKTDSVPYQMRTLARVGSHESLRKIVGGTVAWNQLVQITNGQKTDRGITATIDAITGVITLSGTSTTTFAAVFDSFGAVNGHICIRTYKILTNPNGVTVRPHAFDINWSGANEMVISDCTFRTSSGISGFTANTSLDGITMFANIFDLTQMFGTTIADYIYSLEQATAGAGVAFFKALFPDDYYPYNSGELKSVQTTAHKTYDADGNVIGNYPLDSSLTLRGIPKLDSSNNLYYDGDTYESDGTVTRKYGKMAVPSSVSYMSSILEGTNTVRVSIGNSAIGMMPHNDNTQCMIADFPTYPPDVMYSPNNDFEGISTNKHATNQVIWLRIAKTKLSAYTYQGISDYLQAHPITIVYELATPTTESAAPYTELQSVESGGTEEFVGAEIPVGHESVYPRTLADTMPTQDGSYTLALTVSGGKPSVEWEVNA